MFLIVYSGLLDAAISRHIKCPVGLYNLGLE